MSYNPEDNQSSDENSGIPLHSGEIDITSFIAPTAETTVRFEALQTELLKHTSGERGLSVAHRYDEDPDMGDQVRVAFTQAVNFDVEGNETAGGELTLALDFVDRTTTLQAGEKIPDDFEYAVLVDALRRLGHKLPKNEVQWLEDILTASQLGRDAARLLIPSLMLRSPYASMSYAFHHLPLQGYANGAFMSGNWTFVHREELAGAPPDTKLSYIDLTVPEGDCYRYSRLKEGGERLSVKSSEEQLLIVFGIGSEGGLEPGDIPKPSRRQNRSDINHTTEANMAAFALGLQQALDSGSMVTLSDEESL